MANLKSLLIQVKTGFNKWRLALLIFIIIYAVIVSLGLSTSLLEWDETTHLNGGTLLARGQFSQYIGVNSFYPPMFDVFTMVFFKILGISVLSGRLVAVTFALLSLWVVFELAFKMFGGKTALISSIMLGVMPGFFWLSRLAMIETMLIFFFTLSLFFFYKWLINRQDRMLALSGLALGLGFLTKYQALIAGGIMIASILLLARGYLKQRFSKFALLILMAVIVVTPWIIIAYQTYASNMLNQWIYALQIGNPEKSLYSVRFPPGIFYFIEMTWPYNDVHPISLLLYGVSLAGLGLLAWRRKTEDKFLLIWFVLVFVFFTLIPNKQWRYVMILFPVLAISAASLITSVFDKVKVTLQRQISINKKRIVKLAAGLFIVFLAVGVLLSANDAYHRAVMDQVSIPIEEATQYAATRLSGNESIMLVCPSNLFSQDMVQFYLWADGTRHNPVYQYPELPVDTYTPNFNITEFISLCRADNVKVVFLYEYGTTMTYYNSSLNLLQVAYNITDSGKFTPITNQTMFGTDPRRIIEIEFLG